MIKYIEENFWNNEYFNRICESLVLFYGLLINFWNLTIIIIINFKQHFISEIES